MIKLIIAALVAQTAIVPKPVPVPEPPGPVFRPALIRATESPVMVKSESRVAADNGFFRRVETTVTFTNPNRRAFEGELEFPLPDGAAVCGYALEINGEMVPGVVVGKEEARVAFENEKRKGVDPGVVEHVKGNVWKTRIHPLEPNTPRRCMVAYVACTRASEAEKASAGILAETCNGEVFVAERRPADGPPMSKADRLRAAKTAVILWDASMSRQGKTAADRALLELLPAAGEFTLVVFRNLVEPARKFTTRAALLAEIDALVYDGGTVLDKALAGMQGSFGRLPAFVFSDEYREPAARDVVVRKLAAGDKPPVEPKDGTLLATVWAANRIEDYSADAEARKAEFLELGRKYGVASPVTSLIVLETLEQYKTYRIEPPRCMSFYDSWMKWRAAEDDPIAAEKAKSEHRSQLLRYWEERVKWWNDPIPRKTTPKSGVFDGVRTAVRRAANALSGSAARSAANDSAPMTEAVSEEAAAAPIVARSMAGGARPEPVARSRAAADDSASAPAASIRIAAWNPKMPYLEAMDKAGDAYAEYLRQRELFGSSPAFFLDCAGWFFRRNGLMLGARIISNLSEMKLEEVGLWRTMGWRLREAGLYDEAVEVFRHVLELRPEEPQSRRDLALVLTERGKASKSAKDLEEAAKLLNEAAFTPSARRSGRRGNDLQTSVIAVEELNGILTWAKANGLKVAGEPDAAFRREMPLRLRIMLSWDTDETDVDLHVLEPDGEEAYYGHRRTSTGGFVSEDVTTGYGPEEYLRKDAQSGVYRIMANYFASHRQALTGAATVTATVYTDWATDREKREIISFRLDKPKDKHPIGEVKIGPSDNQ